MSSGFAINLKGTKSFDGKMSTEFDPFWQNPVSTPGYSMSAAYSARGDFGLHTGFRIILPASASMQSGRVSIKVALRFAT